MEINQRFILCLASLDLPEKELIFLANALVEAAETRIGELKAAVATAQLQSDDFAVKYQMEYPQFKGLYQKNPADLQEDFVAWGFWEKIHANRSSTLTKYEKLISAPRDC